MIVRLTEGCEEIISGDLFEKKLMQQRPLLIKTGFDPTAPDLHLGHSVLLNKLKQFQEAGHKVIFLVGDFTAMIGDPSGKNATRPSLSREVILENAKTYQDQVGRLLDVDQALIKFNSEWLGQLNAEGLVRLASSITLARLLEREDFHQRYHAQQPIALHELLYPLLQGYDSVILKADVELGGTDQTFNLLMGRELQKQAGQEPQVVMTLPLLEGLDGTRKMSKSLNNYIGLTESPNSMFGKIMSISDELMWRYFHLLQVLPASRIQHLQKAVSEGMNPRDVKIELAKGLVSRFHDSAAATNAHEAFNARFQQGLIPEDLIAHPFEGDHTVPHLLKALGMTSSTSEAIRLIQQGGVKVNDEKISDPGLILPRNRDYILQIGRRRIEKVRIV